MNTIRVSAERIFDGQAFHQHSQLVIENGVVIGIEANSANNADVDHHVSGLLTPGFIDIQVNGGGGTLFNDTPEVDGLKAIAAGHRPFGTTSMLPTLITDEIDVMEQAADAVALARQQGVHEVIGIHFEGPHLSVAKKGAHCAEFIRPIADREWQILSRQDLGQIVVTVAPENVSAQDIKKMVSLGVKVCLGHSNADFHTVQAAINAGADGFTHLYNAMSAFTSREPGMVGAALLNDDTTCGLIVDGHHVDYVSCQLALKNKPEGKLLLVTDAMPVVGSNMTNFELFKRTVTLSDGRLNLASGELAGSALDMATAVRNTVVKLNQPLDKALKMASLYPAQYLGIASNYGHLQPGAKANFVVLNEQVEVLETWVAGELQLHAS